MMCLRVIDDGDSKTTITEAVISISFVELFNEYFVLQV